LPFFQTRASSLNPPTIHPRSFIAVAWKSDASVLGLHPDALALAEVTVGAAELAPGSKTATAAASTIIRRMRVSW
jgi:hypothetical protein